MHCAIQLPPEGADTAQLRVGTARYHWKPGECIVFDESCEHEVVVRAEASGPRVVLVIDFANPLLTREEDYLATLHIKGQERPEEAEAALSERYRSAHAALRRAIGQAPHASGEL